MKKNEFISAFRITRMIIFEVNYYTLLTNKKPRFITSANQFIRSKLDWAMCGQAQEEVLPKGSLAYKFYKKWNYKHLSDLSLEEYNDLINDLEKLKNNYKYIMVNLNENEKPYNPKIRFYDLKKLSMEI